ncbi:hypothetical protein [Edaphobacter aggregans]|uniref:hypothetical protein n=1 Tax=Edaphobacter aggregans TaxID=570835 RepID=UPI00054DB79D|nr:hypothetical protein [Edaphobacter aggregans]
MTSRLKPMQLLWFIGISNIAVTVAVIAMAVQSWHQPEGQRLSASIKTPCVTVIAVSLAAGFLGEWLLQRGVRSGAWSSAFLDLPRRLLAHPVVKTLSVAIGIFAILYFFAHPVRWLSFYALFMCLPLSLSRISMTLRPKETTEFSSSELSGSDLHPAKPIQSDHWGN